MTFIDEHIVAIVQEKRKIFARHSIAVAIFYQENTPANEVLREYLEKMIKKIFTKEPTIPKGNVKLCCQPSREV